MLSPVQGFFLLLQRAAAGGWPRGAGTGSPPVAALAEVWQARRTALGAQPGPRQVPPAGAASLPDANRTLSPASATQVRGSLDSIVSRPGSPCCTARLRPAGGPQQAGPTPKAVRDSTRTAGCAPAAAGCSDSCSAADRMSCRPVLQRAGQDAQRGVGCVQRAAGSGRVPSAQQGHLPPSA